MTTTKKILFTFENSSFFNLKGGYRTFFFFALQKVLPNKRGGCLNYLLLKITLALLFSEIWLNWNICLHKYLRQLLVSLRSVFLRREYSCAFHNIKPLFGNIIESHNKVTIKFLKELLSFKPLKQGFLDSLPKIQDTWIYFSYGLGDELFVCARQIKQ